MGVAAASTRPQQIVVIASAPIVRASSLVPRILSIPPWNVVCARTNSIRERRTLTGEFDGTMNESFRRHKFRVTGASQFGVATINGDPHQRQRARAHRSTEAMCRWLRLPAGL